MDCNITVGCRIRPLNKQELDLGNGSVWATKDENTVMQVESQSGTGKLARHVYDYVFDQDKDNNYVYEKLGQPIISGVLDGFHGTIFAYGQTSSGKTHTLLGVPQEMGIIVHSVHDIFEYVHRAPPEMEFLIRVSYMEIYNEEIKDLLGTTTDGDDHKSLRIVDDPQKGCQIVGLKEVVVISPDHVFELLKSGEEKRHYGATRMNYTSSRSHTVFRLVVESRVEGAAGSKDTCEEKEEVDDQDDDTASVASAYRAGVQTATLNLVDLAGSERVSKTEATGLRLKEGASINKSLLVLGTVINKLAEGKKGHIPFRDSKLTRLLKNSLGGNARTAVVCTLSPAERNLEESRSTLQFASRAKTIVNKAKKNQILDKSALLDQYKKEIAELKLKLASGDSVVDMPQLDQIRQQLKQEEAKRMELEEKYEKEAADREKEKEELANMRKLVLLTSKVAANPSLTAKMQEKIRSVASGEQKPSAVLHEIEELADEAEKEYEEEEKQWKQDGSSKITSFADIGKVLNFGRSRRRRLSSLCSGIVASMAEQRKSEEQDEGEQLWRKHLGEKIETLEGQNQELRTRLQSIHEERLDSESVSPEAFRKKVERVTELEMENREHQSKLAQRDAQIKELESKLNQEKDNAKTLQDELNHARSAIASSSRTSDEKLRLIETKNIQLTEQLAKSQQRLKEVEAVLTAKESQLQRVHAEKVNAERINLETVSKHEKQLEELVEKLETQQRKAHEQLEAQKQQLLAFKTKVDDYEVRFQELGDQGNQEAKVAALENQLASSKYFFAQGMETFFKQLETIESKAGDVHHLSSKLQNLEKQLQVLHVVGHPPQKPDPRRRRKEGEEEEEEEEENTWHQSRSHNEKSEDDYRRECRETSLVREVEVLKTKLADAECQLANNATAAEYHKQMQVALNQRDTLLRELETSDAELDQLKARIRALEARLEDTETENIHLAKQLELRTREAHQASASVRALNQQVESKLTEYQLMLDDADRLNESLRQQVVEAEARLFEMQKRLKRARADADLATDTFMEYQRSAEAREAHLKSLHHQLGGPVEKQDDLNSQIASLQSKLKISSSSSVSSSSVTTKKSSHDSSDLIRLKHQLRAAQEELDVFHRLDIYSTSFKRGLQEMRSITTTNSSTRSAERLERLLKVQNGK